MLEDHGNLVAPENHQFLVIHGSDVVSVNDNVAGSGLDQSNQAAHHGRFAASRQSHDYERLALLHLERHVVQADDNAQFSLQVGLASVSVLRIQRPLRIFAEDLPNGVNPYDGPLTATALVVQSQSFKFCAGMFGGCSHLRPPRGRQA